MKIYEKIVFDLDGHVIEEKFFEYKGQVALCDKDPPQQQGIGAYQPASIQELLLKSAGTMAPLVAHTLSNRRHPTVMSNLLGLTAGLAGGTAGVFGQEMANQRLDPVAQQLRVGAQLQALGTKPLGPSTAPIDPSTLRLPGAEEPPVFPPAPLTTSPGMPGYPTFNIENIPERERLTFAKEIAPMQQLTTAKAQQEYAKAHQKYVEVETQQLTDLPTPEAAAADLQAKIPTLPPGMEVNLTQKTKGGGTVTAKTDSALDVQRKRNDALNEQFTNAIADEIQRTGKPFPEAADAVYNRESKIYGGLPTTSPGVAAAHEYRSRMYAEQGLMSRQAFQEQQANARNAANIAAEFRRLHEAPLPIQYSGQYFRYNNETKEVEPAPPTASLDEIRKGKYTHLSDAKMKGMSELDTANADFQAIKALSEQMKGHNAASLQLGKSTGGNLGAAVGAKYDTARTRFGPIFDRLLGGTRAAASVPFANMIGRTLPSFIDSSDVIDFKNSMTQILIDSLKDEKVRAAFGQPVNQETLKRITELGKQLDAKEKAQKAPGAGVPRPPGLPPGGDPLAIR